MRTYPIPEIMMRSLVNDYEMCKNHPQRTGIRGGTKEYGVCATRLIYNFYRVLQTHIFGSTEYNDYRREKRHYSNELGGYYHQASSCARALTYRRASGDPEYQERAKAGFEIYLTDIHRFIETLSWEHYHTHWNSIGRNEVFSRTNWNEEKDRWEIDVRDLQYPIEHYKRIKSKFEGTEEHNQRARDSIQERIDEWEKRLEELK